MHTYTITSVTYVTTYVNIVIFQKWLTDLTKQMFSKARHTCMSWCLSVNSQGLTPSHHFCGMCACQCIFVIRYVFTLFPIFPLSFCVLRDTKRRGRLKWAVSQCPGRLPSCRNLIINNHWHIRDKGRKCVLCVHTKVCVCTYSSALKCITWKTTKNWQGRAQ